MRLNLVVLLALCGTCVAAGHHPNRAGYKIAICIEGHIDWLLRDKAEMMASRILKYEDITVRWRGPVWSCAQRGADEIVVTLVAEPPASMSSDALGYAYVFEGVHAQICLDCILRFRPDLWATLLGHVMAHEVTHLLQGVNRHSAEGLMKAQWGFGEIESMGTRPLRFTAWDIKLIELGMERRSALSVKSAGTHSPPALSTVQSDPTRR